MNILEKEYQHFGPWLLEIKSKDDIPQQYLNKQKLILESTYSFKVPINKDRRKVRQGTLLYNQVIALYPDKIVILSIKNNKIKTKEMLTNDIKYFIHGGELLINYIYCFSNNDVIKIKYNSASLNVSQSVVNIIRNSIISDSAEIRVSDNNDQSLYDLQLYKYFCTKEINDKPLKIIGYQANHKLEKIDPKKLEFLVHKFMKTQVQDSLILSNGLELIIVDRGKDFLTFRDTNYAYRHTFIKLDKIKSVSLVPDSNYKDLQSLVIQLNGINVNVKVLTDYSINFIEELLT